MLKELWVPEFVKKFSNLREAKIHGWSDYISCAYSVWLFLICCAATGWKLNFSKPIHCMMPAQFVDSWVSYAQDYCFVQSTYMVADLDDMYRYTNRSRTELSVSYYQWVPYILFVQAFLFFVPKIFWTFTLSNFCAMSLDTAITEAEDAAKDLSEKRQEGLARYSKWLQEHIDFVYDNRLFKVFPSTIICYIITKWLYVFIACLQLRIITLFVGNGDYSWAFKAVYNSVAAAKWIRLDAFPYITFCKVPLTPDFGNLEEVNLQCLLVMNMLNDKILVFLSLWMTIVLAISLAAALYATVFYIYLAISPNLRGFMPSHSSSDARFCKFVNTHIHLEGIFILQMLKQKVNPFLASEVVTTLYKKMVDSETRNLAPNLDGVMAEKNLG